MDYEENHNKLIDAILSGCVDKALLNRLLVNVMDPKLFVQGTKDKRMSPVGACVVCGNMELLKILVSFGASLDFSGTRILEYTVLSPVDMAIKSQRPDMLQKLLEAGACCSEYDTQIYRAMFYSDKKLRCFEVLMKHIMDKNRIVYGEDNDRGNLWFSPFHVALDYRQGMYKGWEIDEQDDFKEDLEEDILEDKNVIVRLVDTLIRLGFPLDPVMMIMWMGYPIEPVPVPINDWCPLELAIINRKAEAAVLLIKAGCAINCTEFHICKHDDDILQYCIKYRTFELIQILVHAGAKLTIKHMKAIQKILNERDIHTYRFHDSNKRPSMELVAWLTKEDSDPASLKRICRVIIRNHLRLKTKGCTILPSIEQLEIPQHTKEYLALEIQ